MPRLTVGQIAALCDGVPTGEIARVISGAAALETATPVDVSFAAGKKALALAAASNAGCLLVDSSFDSTGPWAVIRAANPRVAFAQVLNALYPPKSRPPSVHPTAVIASRAQLAPDCYIGAHVSIGDGTVIAARCVVESSCIIGDNVTIGADTFLHPNVTLYDGVTIGARVIIHAGCVIGADGFGFTFVDGRYVKFPQVGTVCIGDDVEIGAQCCIDRAALGTTRIGNGVKLDNLIHIAHNCVLGEHVVVAAQTGFSGSVTVGDFAVIGGQVGIGEKAKIEARAIIGGKAGILTSATVHAGEPVWGIPARPLRKHLKGLANVSRIPELKGEIQELRQKILFLEAELLKEKK